jgi:hypothetical protein
MKKIDTMLKIAIVICLVGASYNYGKLKGLDFVEYETRSEIATRYLQIIGNPTTQEEQCNFEKIVYNDSTECKLAE